ncbi:MAG: LytTR family DNA-binding domain-containing protein [Bacteroidota bacterium]
MIRSIIIDDEEDARVSLKLLLDKFCPEVELVDMCPDPRIGLEAILAHDPDLVFLDVQMPHMSGFDLLEKIESPRFQTIFVTAHDKYAIKAIRFSALDYLLKPVDMDELLSAVARVNSNQSAEMPLSNGYHGVLHNVKHRLGQDGKLAIPTSEGMAFINIRDIIHCEADGSYTRLHVQDKKPMLVSKKLKDFENILDPNAYCRVHHSNMINLSHVERYVKGEGGYVIMSNGQQVDISRRKKEEFMKLIAKM